MKARNKAAVLQPSDNTLKPWFMLVNNGRHAIPLNQLKIRYWFTRDRTQTTGLQATCDSATLGCGVITGSFQTFTPRTNADTYLEVGFTSTAKLYPGQNTGDIQMRVNWSDWVNFNESNDYSYYVHRSARPGSDGDHRSHSNTASSATTSNAFPIAHFSAPRGRAQPAARLGARVRAERWRGRPVSAGTD